ncbi:Endonuclease/exonuclease/phosphatase, partial [Mycena vitilis]
RKTRAHLKICGLNINGRKHDSISNPDHKWNKAHRMMFDEQIGALIITETHMSPAQIQEIEENEVLSRRMEIFHTSNPDNPSTRGVAIVLNRELTNTKNVRVHYLIPGRAILAVIPWHGRRTLTLLGVYAPAESMEENKEFWDQLYDLWMTTDLPVPDCMAGDTNIVEEPADRFPHRSDCAAATAALARFKRLLDLQDGWRKINPDAKEYTFASNHGTLSRIDRIYVSPATLKYSRDWLISDAAGGLTDHRMVSVQIRAPGAPYIGKGRYTIPLFLLRDEAFMEFTTRLGAELEKKINNAPEDAHSIQMGFKSFKEDIRDYARARAKVAVGALEQKKKKLQKEREGLLNSSDAEASEITPTEQPAAQIQQQNNQNEQRERKRTDTRIRCYTELDRITKFTVNMSKDRKPRDTIDFLQRTDTTPARGSKKSCEMAEIARDYHNDLQRDETEEDPNKKTAAIQAALEGMKSHNRDPRMRALEKLLTEEDVATALSQSSNSTAAGMNGIPNELWKKLHELYLGASGEDGPRGSHPTFNVVKTLTLVYNNIQKSGVVPGTQFATGW